MEMIAANEGKSDKEGAQLLTEMEKTPAFSVSE